MATYIRQVAGSGPVVATYEGKPVASLVMQEDTDLETVVLSTHPEFLLGNLDLRRAYAD
jgi:hypothetical protein